MGRVFPVIAFRKTILGHFSLSPSPYCCTSAAHGITLCSKDMAKKFQAEIIFFAERFFALLYPKGYREEKCHPLLLSTKGMRLEYVLRRPLDVG